MKAKKLLALFILSLAIVYMPAHAEIYVATAGPMTGQNAAYGEYMANGAKLAAKHLNAKGGVLGKSLFLK